ncbi:MAG: winged helix-turn-helix domain-containing protein [Acidobacteria bacterium]|nr:winged helix-turn-helix domain-containing protein [Acidobacteriota bacterium]MCA1643429.1 winged helix-turn-helix domain-containing protein [Acidobacteriota bacterium]
MSEPAGHFYEFGPYRVDAAEQQLWRDGEEVALTPKAFGVLLLLIRNRGRVIGKDDFMREVWADSFVEEKNITDNISILRQALGDDAREPQYIKTVPRRGYRFVGEVVEVQDGEIDLVMAERTRAHIVFEEQDRSEGDVHLAGQVAEAGERSLVGGPAIARRTRWNLRRVVIASTCLLLGVSAVAVYLSRATLSTPTATNIAPIRSIAVLPFKPLVAAERDESLEMGMADTLIAKLSRVNQLAVRPTNAVRQYTKLEDETARAGRELQVDSVLDGSIQKAGDRIRVTVRLIRPARGETLWTEQFDEKFTDIFTVQDAISGRVAAALSLKLGGEERARLTKRETDNPEAYQLYLKGRYFWYKFSPADHAKAAEYFNQAIAKDPGYALAYSGLADTNAASAVNNWLPPREGFAKGKAAAQKALEIDSTLAEAHSSLGAASMFYDLNWAAAEREFSRAIELNPRYVATYGVYSYLLSATGRLDEGIEMARRGLELDQLSAAASDDLAGAYYLARRYDEATKQYYSSLEMEPGRPSAHLALGIVYEQQSKYEEAIAEYKQAISLSERTSPILGQMGHAYALSGKRNEALKILGELQERSSHRYATPYDLAILYTGLGERDQALQQLKKACEERSGWIINLKIEPQFDPLRADPRYAALLRSLNLPT